MSYEEGWNFVEVILHSPSKYGSPSGVDVELVELLELSDCSSLLTPAMLLSTERSRERKMKEIKFEF